MDKRSAVNLPVETDLTMMQLYPHSKKPLHYAMGLVTAIIFVPAGYIAFPLLLALKLVLYPLPYLALSLLPDRAAGRI